MVGRWAANMILDDGGDATLLVHLGIKVAKDAKASPSPRTRRRKSSTPPIANRLKQNPGWYAEVGKSIRGVTEETTTGVHRLYEMAKKAGCCSRPSTSTTA